MAHRLQLCSVTRRQLWPAPFAFACSFGDVYYLTASCGGLTSPARNNGWQLYGQSTLTFDQKRGEVICGQVITKVVEGKTYDPELDLSKL